MRVPCYGLLQHGSIVRDVDYAFMWEPHSTSRASWRIVFYPASEALEVRYATTCFICSGIKACVYKLMYIYDYIHYVEFRSVQNV